MGAAASVLSIGVAASIAKVLAAAAINTRCSSSGLCGRSLNWSNRFAVSTAARDAAGSTVINRVSALLKELVSQTRGQRDQWEPYPTVLAAAATLVDIAVGIADGVAVHRTAFAIGRILGLALLGDTSRE